MTTRSLVFPALLAGLLLAASVGCSHKISGGPESGVDMAKYRSYYVVTGEKADVADAINKDLTARGFTVTTGPESGVPPTADSKVNFRDKWVWDMTMYLLEVKIEMLDARSGALLASGRCYRTSMARKSPDEMVKEIMDRIYPNTPVAKPQKSATASAN